MFAIVGKPGSWRPGSYDGDVHADDDAAANDHDYFEGGESGDVVGAHESSKKSNDNVDSRTQYAHRLDFALGKQHKLAPEPQGSS